MSIVSDSLPLEASKNPETCNVFGLYSLLASEEQNQDMKAKYEAGGYGYGHAKQALLELILEKFSKERAQFDYLMAHKDEIDATLNIGADKARIVATEVLKRVREKIGY
jgi:tryptophanyl-tRNA synthetase